MQDPFEILTDSTKGMTIEILKHLSMEECDTLFEILKNSTCHEKVKIKFTLKSERIINERYILDAVIKTNHLNKWIDFFKSGQCHPSHVTLDFNGCYLTGQEEDENNDVESLVFLLTHPNCPSYLNLILNRSGVYIDPFANALKSGKCKPNLALSFLSTLEDEADDEALKLLSALENKNCPSGLRLDLRDNKFSPKIIVMLAHAIMKGKLPENMHLSLNLWDSNIDDKAWNEIIEALKMKNNLSLTVQFTSFNSFERATLLAGALTSGAGPGGLTLEFIDCFLEDGRISRNSNGLRNDINVLPILGALKHPDCLSNLTLFFNFFNRNHLPALIDILKNNLSPKNLRFEFLLGDYEDLDETVEMMEQFKEVMQCNTTITKLEFQRNDDAVPEFIDKNPYVLLWQGGKTYDEFFPKNPNLVKRRTELQKYIDLCCLRNQLMYKHPELAEYIKRVSSEEGYYVPNYRPPFPPSLKVLAGQACIFSRVSLPSDVPVEVKQYLQSLTELKNQFSLNIDSVLGKRKRGNSVS